MCRPNQISLLAQSFPGVGDIQVAQNLCMCGKYQLGIFRTDWALIMAVMNIKLNSDEKV
jgi:hypothetical protein